MEQADKATEYQERKKARAERFRSYAENARTRAVQAYERSKRIGDCIPMGQPILVGHHSERRHRADLKRIENGMQTALKEDRKAEYWERRAEAVLDSNAIFADDPEAMDKLDAKADRLLAYVEEMKRINKEWRKNGGNLDAIEMSEKMRERARGNLQVWTRGGPFPAFLITNARARMRKAQERKEVIEKAKDFEGFELNGHVVKAIDGRIEVHCAFKPDAESRSKLKRSPLALKWSRWATAWVRKQSAATNGAYFEQELRKALSELKADA